MFTAEQETILCDYIIKYSLLNYGLNYRQMRQLSHDYANCYNSKIPNGWVENKIVGIDWLKCFMKRQLQFTLRKPNNTSLSRTTAFNKANVQNFLTTTSVHSSLKVYSRKNLQHKAKQAYQLSYKLQIL